MLIDNVEYLVKYNRNLRDKLKNSDESSIDLHVTNSKNGYPIVQVEIENHKYSIHSKYDPIKEAERILKTNEKELNTKKHVIFYGIGFGYHIEKIISMYKDNHYYLYEPSLSIFQTCLMHRKLKDIVRGADTRIVVQESEQDVDVFLNSIASGVDEDVLLIPLPTYESVFTSDYSSFLTKFKEILINKKINLSTNIVFQHRWTLNSLNNLKYTLNSSNILINNYQFKNKPTIIVSAGPSLIDEIENLREIKEKGTAYIFAVGSANKVLIKNGIDPDAVCSIDPASYNHKVLSEIIDTNLDIPLIYGTSIGYETLENYPGSIYHMITSQDSVTPFFLSDIDDKIPMVMDAPSVAIVTLQMLNHLGASPIILVGQNLAFKNDEFYSKGIEYENRAQKITDKDIEAAVKIKGVNGDFIQTNITFNLMRTTMESIIRGYQMDNVINTTKNGAHIEGTTFVPLQEVMREMLVTKVVDSDWNKKITHAYNSEIISGKYTELVASSREQLKYLDNLFNIIGDINKNIRSNEQKLERLFLAMDKQLKKMERNTFYKIFIMPSIRIQREQLIKLSTEIKKIENSNIKAEKIISGFGKYVTEVNNYTKIYTIELEKLNVE